MPQMEQQCSLLRRLVQGGAVLVPMTETFFAQRFGMVADRFGLTWLVLAAPVEGV
jgi:PhnB protein